MPRAIISAMKVSCVAKQWLRCLVSQRRAVQKGGCGIDLMERQRDTEYYDGKQY